MISTTAVVGLNLTLAGLCLLASWRLWGLRHQLAQLTHQLNIAARQVQTGRSLPDVILQGRQSTANLRHRQIVLQRQLRLLGQLLTVLGWWRTRGWRR